MWFFSSVFGLARAVLVPENTSPLQLSSFDQDLPRNRCSHCRRNDGGGGGVLGSIVTTLDCDLEAPQFSESLKASNS